MAPSSPLTLMEMQIRCEMSQVRRAGQSLHRFLKTSGCSETEVMDCELALVEACNNAIKYVRPEARNLPVAVQVVCQAAQIEVRVTDHTAGFDWTGKAVLPNLEAESGRGVYLIKTLMDFSEYLRLPDRNVLVLRKSRVSSARP